MTIEQGDKIISLLERIAGCSLAPAHDQLALETAKQIEDIFAQGHCGGRTQRLTKVQCAILGALHRAAPTGWR